jgi:hypothetical protein
MVLHPLTGSADPPAGGPRVSFQAADARADGRSVTIHLGTVVAHDRLMTTRVDPFTTPWSHGLIVVLCAGCAAGADPAGPHGADPGDPPGASMARITAATPLDDADSGRLTVEEALMEFADCMSYVAFTTPNAAGDSAASIADASSSDGACAACHSQGDGGFWASTDALTMFQANQQLPYLAVWVEATATRTGNFKDLVPSHKIVEGASGKSHPHATIPTGQVEAINRFVSDALDSWHYGLCGPTGPAAAPAE